MNTTPLDEAIEAAAALPEIDSGIGHIAQACGTSRQFINKMRRQWRSTGVPPRALREYAPAIEHAVHGRVRADDLCPDVAWSRGEDGRVTHYTVPVRPRVSHVA
ncbi:MAG: helix-turn-helix domain-containing protein [Proteobacteria bacterium]|nr:helix-turn-helix domain-containing protein [Pseudomonadota bacterium]